MRPAPATVDDALRRWVRACAGSAPGPFEPIAPGLGHRSFYRVRFPDADSDSDSDPDSDADALPGAPRSLVLRVDPPEARVAVAGVAPEPELEPIRALLEASGLPVPRSFGHDAARGLDLLEDVGDDTLEAAAACAEPSTRRALYREAIDLTARLQAIEAPADPATRPAAFARHLDRALIATKAHKVIEWLLPESLGREPTPGERGVVEAGFDAIADLVSSAPARLAHRDYKAANIHVRAASSDPRGGRLVLIDLQGAFLAPPEYDLVCLLRDSHVPLAVDEVEAQLAWALPRLPDAPPYDEARLRFDALTIARVGKDLAHYLDAARRRGDDRYLGFVATGLERLRAAAAGLRTHDALWRDLAELVEGLPLPVRCAEAPRPRGEPPSCAR